MSVQIDAIGAGMIGPNHIRRITDLVSGAEVVTVADVDGERACGVAGGVNARPLPTGKDLINDREERRGTGQPVMYRNLGGRHAVFASAAGSPKNVAGVRLERASVFAWTDRG